MSETGIDVQFRVVESVYLDHRDNGATGLPHTLDGVYWDMVEPRFLRAHPEPEARHWIKAVRKGKLPARSWNGETNGATAPSGDGRRVELVRASTIKPEPVRWVWADRIAQNALTLLAGIPGLGKSTMALWVAARLSRGELPGDQPGALDAVIATAEDSTSTTLVPRLMAAGADMDRIHFLRLWSEGFEDGLVLPDDIAVLEAALRGVPARLLVIDPIMAHLGGKIDSHKDQSIRRALAPLHRLAEDLGIAVLPIGHLNKAPSGDIFARVGGSVGLTAAARSILLVTPDPENEEDESARVLSHAKSNLSALAPALRFRVETRYVDDGEIKTSAIVLGDEAPHIQVADLLAPAKSEEQKKERDYAKEWLQQFLADGRQPSKEIFKAGRAEGHREITVRRAKEDLGIVVKKDGFRPANWYWKLPDHEDDQSPDGEGVNIFAGPQLPEQHPAPPRSEDDQSLEVSIFEAAASSDHRCACGCGRDVGGPGITHIDCQGAARMDLPDPDPDDPDEGKVIHLCMMCGHAFPASDPWPCPKCGASPSGNEARESPEGPAAQSPKKAGPPKKPRKRRPRAKSPKSKAVESPEGPAARSARGNGRAKSRALTDLDGALKDLDDFEYELHGRALAEINEATEFGATIGTDGIADLLDLEKDDARLGRVLDLIESEALAERIRVPDRDGGHDSWRSTRRSA